jgi:branched-chain amino acid transport system permease protein
MEIFFQQFVNGLSIGSIYVLVALGITLVFGVSRLLNFAHGQLLLLGSFLAFAFVSAGLPFILAAILATLGTGLAGLAVGMILRPTLGDPVNAFIVSLGLTIGMGALFVLIWPNNQYVVHSPFSGVIDVGGVAIAVNRLVTFFVAVLCVGVLLTVLRKTRLGRSMRAASENEEAAALQGVKVKQANSAAFVIGALLAGVGGAFLATLFPFDAYSGEQYLIKGLAVALIGGLGRIEGAVVVGLSLGVIEALGTQYLIGAEWRDGYAFLAIVLVLLWRPGGLFGTVRQY